jgi:ppGpp synthetase/RelA/SpoT-type nucleotidyltranferase
MQDVELQLAKDGDKFRAVTAAVRSACERVEAELGEGVVRRIYGRADKQGKLNLAQRDLKDPGKIALALQRLESINVTDVEDVSGLTVVVHYSDQIDNIVERITEYLDRQRIRIKGAPKIRKSGGYYATHVVFRSEHTDHRNFCCEVQVKTMLHDAWAAKTHDLTYKPRGQHDQRFDRMMDVFADALQAIEVQSETLRDVIEERSAAEVGWRNIVRHNLFEFLPYWMDQGLRSKAATQLRDEIKARKDKLASADENDNLFQDIAGRVDDLCRTSLREGYLLEAYISIIRDRPKDRSRALDQARRWLAVADREYRAGNAGPCDVWSVPMIFYVCGDLEMAIHAAEQLKQCRSLEGRDREVLLFNLANHLIEQAYFRLPQNTTDRADLEKKIKELLSAAPGLRAEDPTPFYDAEGMFAVAFSQDPSEIRAAIDQIQKGKENVPPEDKAAADAYYELNIRLAWRRLIEIETRVAREKRSSRR